MTPSLILKKWNNVPLREIRFQRREKAWNG